MRKKEEYSYQPTALWFQLISSYFGISNNNNNRIELEEASEQNTQKINSNE